MLLYYKNMLEQDTQNCLREREKGGGRVYLFGRLESCKSNSNLLVCSEEISVRSTLSTFQVAGRQWRSAGDIQDQF